MCTQFFIADLNPVDNFRGKFPPYIIKHLEQNHKAILNTIPDAMSDFPNLLIKLGIKRTLTNETTKGFQPLKKAFRIASSFCKWSETIL